MAQYVIDTGAFPNDGTGDPLRTAFEYVNLNFDQIFNAGPVLSNIEIRNNTIYSTNTNGNIVLNPNGIGNVIANAHVIPDQTRIRNLGAPELKWDTVYAQYLVGDGNGISNVTAANISNGTARVDAYFNANVAVTANGVANVAVFTATGLSVPNTILAGIISGNINTTNISGNSVTISATGTNQGISLAPNGTGNVSVNFRHVVNLAEPVNPQDAATKYYVDTVAEGLDVKASCLLATYATLPAYTYNNGASGVGATITGNAVGTLSIDSTTVTANSRVLIKNESGANEPYNGIYVVARTGNASVSFQLIRSTDFDNGAPSGEIPGAFTFIETGTVNADTGWVCTTNNPVSMGVTPIVWSQFSGAGAYTAGLGLDLVGGVFNVLVDNNTTEINLNNQVAVKPGANLVTPNIGSATGTSLSLTGAITANTVNTSGNISTTANITGGNLNSTGAISAVANITGGNIATAGFITASGQITSAANITGGNIKTAGQVTATGNVYGANLIAIDNVIGGNVLTTGVISAQGNITGNNVSAADTISAVTANVSGNVNSGNILNSGIVSAVGNVIGGNLRTAGQITATGNLTVGNVRTAGLVSAGGEIVANGNISGANIVANGVITASGNIISNQYFIGNGAFLTGIDATSIQNGNSNVRVLANANVTVGVAGTSNVAVFANTGLYVSGEISATGNITGANVSTNNVAATGNVSAGNVLSNTLIGTDIAVISTGNIVLSATGNINVANTYITNLANPVNLQDAATKYYVDTVATGLDPKESVVYATASVLGVPYTYNNGASGVGATITSNLPGALSIDGNAVQSGQRVLIKNETGAFVSNTVPSAAFNGIYDVTVAGDVGNAWVLTRSADFNQSTEMASSFTFVEAGSTNADSGWVCTTNNPITVGFTQIVFTQFSGAGTYTAGNGLSLNGTVFNVNTDGNIAINGNNQVSIATNAILNSPNITNATATSLSASGNITGGNILFGDGIVSGTGNIYANKIFANIQGNVDAAGNLYEIQFNTTGDQLGANANFTYDFANNVFTVANGNITGGNILTGGRITATGNVYGSWFVGNVDAETVNASANISGGNILTSGVVSATSTGTFGNVLTGGIISATSTIQGGNILTSGDVSATGPVTGGNIYTGGVVSAVGTVTGGNLVTAGSITATGDITGGNVVTAGYVSAGGNVAGANLSTAGNVTAANVSANNGFFGNLNLTGNITANSLLSNTVVSATGTGTFGNVVTAGFVSATGNVSGNYFVGNGAFLTGIDTTLISNGNTNVQTYANGNVSVTVAGVANTVVFTVTGVDVAGNVSASGNITGGNIATAGAVSATGNVSGGNVNTSTVWSSSDLNLQPVGNVSLGNRYVTGVRYPSADQDAASKIYVDNLVSTAISYHEAVYVATTTTLAATTGGTITYNQPGGAGNGIGATLTTTGSFNLIDTANVQTAGTRILVKNEANATHNGVYVWSNATVITRSSDADTSGVGNAFALGLNDYFFVANGNVNLGSAWIVDAPTGNIVFGTSNIEFAQFSQSQVYSANTSAGLSLIGTVFSTKVDNNTTAFDGGGNISVKAGANLTTPNIGAATGTSLSVTGNVEGGNIATVGYVTATGNITGGNIVTAGNITATGNITANYFIGNGSQLTDVTAASMDAANLTGNTLSSNVLFSSLTTVGTLTSLSVSGNVDGGNIHTAGTVSATGTVVGGNIATAGSVTATGDVTGGNILTGGYVTATGTGTFGNILTGGIVSATSSLLGGNVLTPGDVSAGGSLTGGNIFTGGQISAVSTVTGGNIATTGYVTATGNITGGNIISAGQISSTGNITAPTFVGNLEATIVTATGNVTGGNILFGSGVVSGTGNIYANKIFANIVGNIDAAGNLYEVQFNTTGDQLGATANFTYDFVNNVLTVANGNIVGGNLSLNNNINANGNITTGGFVSAVGNVTAPWFIGNVNAATLSASGNINGGNLLIAGTISSVGNITAPTFIGNLVGNITGNIDAGGANTEIQFNDNDILAGSPGFTFNKTSNLVTVTGNVTAGNVISQGIVTANLGVYGDIYTTSIDSADSSAIIVTPDMVLLASLDVNQDITVGNILIPSYGNITVGNVRIANLANPILDQDAVTKRYVDSAIGNVLPIITNQTISPDGSSLTYTLTQSTTAVGVLVTINGISQTPNDSYTVSGDQITFAELLLTSDIVQVRFLSGTSTGGGGSNYANANVVAYAESGWAGNIIPQGNLVYNLGNSTNRWNDLYLSGNTIYLDSATIGANGADVTFSGNITGGNILTSGLISANQATSQAITLLATAANSLVSLPHMVTQTWPHSWPAYGSNTISTTGNITAGNLIGNISVSQATLQAPVPTFSWLPAVTLIHLTTLVY
jgi:hypothetical protein